VLDTNIISSNTKIGRGVKLKGVYISGNVVIGNGCILNKIELRGNIILGNHNSIWGPNTLLTSQVNKIVIGNYCSIAKNVTVQEYNHNIERFTTYYLNKNILNSPETDVVSKGDIIIGHDVWIGSGVVITSGVKIGVGAVIGANSVVTKDVPPFAIVAGTPARIIKFRFDEETQRKILETEWWNLEKEELKGRLAYLDDLVAKN